MAHRAIENEEFEGFPDLPEKVSRSGLSERRGDDVQRPAAPGQDDQADDAESSDSSDDDDSSDVSGDVDGDGDVFPMEEVLDDFIRQQELGDDDDDDDDDEDGDENKDSSNSKSPAPTADESQAIRRLLHQLGSERFIKHMVTSGLRDPEFIIEALGVKLPYFLSEFQGDAYISAITHLLGAAMNRELSRRVKLDEHNTVDDAADLIAKSRNIIVVTGAGISTSLGIPDFRSKDTGLYSQLQARGYWDPTDVFDIDVFREDPSLFYSVAKDILPSTKRFTPTHAFIADLDRRGKLLTNYTQNIDNIESAAGISAGRLVQCHGSFKTATCFTCGYRVPGEEVFPEIKAGDIPACPRCAEIDAGNKRKRAANGSAKGGNGQNKRRTGSGRSSKSCDDDDESDDESGPNLAIMKPDITFFGEALPDAFHDRLTQNDRDKVDLLIVIGTSLKVRPVSEISAVLPPDVPQIYINRDPISHVNFDILLLGDCDVVVAELVRRMEWDFSHEMIPDDQQITVHVDPDESHCHRFKAARSLPVREEKPEADVPAIAAVAAQGGGT
ncbi:hypothetical protein BROUX41_003482 [Berkeleyomyces rouxiae]|uniref:uncharacterized protein n=1 Tax=Berkeleyomyces rouxiae TaxID=2035830 RepID=UPI003B80110F